jgi:hypothetical protein
VYAPTRDRIREWPILTRLDGWAVVTPWKMFSGGLGGGAVLAARPDAEHLEVVTLMPFSPAWQASIFTV